MIVMEYLDGPIAKNVPLDKIHKYSEDIQSFSLETIFRYKTLHGDFHLGNIIIMNDGKSIGIIDFGIIYSVKNELSDKLFDIVFLSFEVKDIKILNQILKNIIRLICSNESQHKTIFNIMKEDEKLINKMRCNNFSANMLIKLINKIMSLENIEIDSDLCRLLLSTMSSLQTVEYVNNNISLKKMMTLYMSKCVEM
jgi:predicted unusual protein kinase regulating ubiquinone biosynthesis (AarF/ABC1/UbiB family)